MFFNVSNFVCSNPVGASNIMTEHFPGSGLSNALDQQEDAGHLTFRGLAKFTNTGYGTTNADAGLGIGMLKGDSEIWLKNID